MRNHHYRAYVPFVTCSQPVVLQGKAQGPFQVPRGRRLGYFEGAAEQKRPTPAALSAEMLTLPQYVPERPPTGMPSVQTLTVEIESSVSGTVGHSVSTSTSVVAVPLKAAVLYTSALSAVTLNTGLLREAAEARDRIVTVYKHSAFHNKLIQHNLIDQFPLLTRYIEFGFPISIKNPLPPRLMSFTPRHHPGAFLHTDFIINYLEDEERRGRVSKPFPRRVLEAVLGPFYASPLNVIEKARDPAFPDIPKWRLITNCSAKDHGISLNDQLDADDYPTTWDGAEKMAAIVSFASTQFLSLSTTVLLLACGRACTPLSRFCIRQPTRPGTTTVVELGPLDSHPLGCTG